MKLAFIVIALICSPISASYWSVDLTPKEIKNNKDMVDIIYHADAGFKTGENYFNLETALDLTSHENFALSRECS